MRTCKILPHFLFAFLMACGGSNQVDSPSKTEFVTEVESENPDTQGLQHTPITIPWQNSITNILNGFTVECEECHPAVATFVSFKKNKPHSCGGTLIEENKILTAKHCLAKESQKAGASCSDSYFLFPGNGQQSPVAVRCLQVESVSPDYPQLKASDPQPDWAIVKIHGSFPHRVAVTNTEGLGDGQKILFFKPMYDMKKQKVLFKRYNCINFHESDLEPSAEAEISALMLVRCDRLFSRGYSGFGFFNTNGELVGNQSHTVHPKKKKPKNSNHAVGSSIPCVLETTDADVMEACKWEPQVRKKRRKRIILRKVRKAKEKIKKAFAQWLEDHKQFVKWEETDLEALDKMPEEYQKLFADLEKSNKEILPKAKAGELSLLHFPFYPSCFTKVKKKNLDYPIVRVAIALNPENHKPKVKFKIETIKGGMSKGTKGWIFGPTQKAQSESDLLKKGEKAIYQGLISKEVDIKLCQ